MKKFKKVLCLMLLIVGVIALFGNVEAASITATANSVKKGESVTITVTVPNVNTVDLTATVSGAGTNGTIRLVDGALTGEAKTYSKSITVTPTSAGTISVNVSSGSNAVLNGAYVDVSASKSITVTEPPVENNNQNNNNNNSNNNTNTNTNTNTNKPATNNTTTNKNTGATTNKNTNTNSKSSNANLKNMILSVEGLSPAFSKDISNYSITVRESVEEIKVNASVEHSRASYSVSGNTNLKIGENIITVKVTAEDGTVKNYTINVLKSDEPVKSDATLSSLIIEDVDLGQAFDPNVTEYNAGDITVKENKLNIFAYSTNENAKIEILGNEDLKIGEHKITIRVTSENGKIIKDYIVSFNKLYAEEVATVSSAALKETEKENKISNWDTMKEILKENATVIILYLFVWVEFVQVVYLYEKLKKYEDIDKITISRRLKNLYVREIKEKPRREKVNPVFPDEDKKEEVKEDKE